MSDSSPSPGRDGPEPSDPLAAYRSAVRTLGPGFGATLWASPATQVLRFDVLIDLFGPHRLRDRVVLDLGCGDNTSVVVVSLRER